jgi:malate dehydrogenase
MHGEAGVIQCAFVESNVTDAPFFASPCRFGAGGVEQVLPLPAMSAYEKQWLDTLLPELKKQIQKGIDFANE